MTLKVGLNIDKVIEIFGDKIYNSNGSAFREQVVNGLSHGCMQYHKLHGYTDDVFLRIVFDHMLRKVIIIDNGMGMPEERFINVFAAFGNSFNQDGSRSGQHGLGAMSFLRFSSSTLVESYSRETEEHYCYTIEDGKDIDRASNRAMSEHGTRIEITLKENVRISELRDVVVKIAKHYPVKIVLTELNTEGSRPTTNALESYGRVTESIDDSSKIYNPVFTVEQYVQANRDQPFKIESTDPHVEIWLSKKDSTTPSLDLTLCRVPIVPRRNPNEVTNSVEHSVYSTLQSIFDIVVNIDDERGDYRPEHHRDELEINSADKLISVINESIIKFIGTISVSTVDEYTKNPYVWILDANGIDEYLRPETRDISHYLHTTYSYRDGAGKHKEKITLRELIQYDRIFVSDTMVKSTFRSFQESGLFETEDIVFAYPYYTSDEAGYYRRFLSEYEDVKVAKERLQIKSIKRNKQEIKLTVHYLDASRRTSLEDVEDDDSIYIDNESGIKFSQINAQMKKDRDISAFRILYPDDDAAKYGIVIAKAHVKKIERQTFSMSSLVSTIIKQERDVLYNNTLKRMSMIQITGYNGLVLMPDYMKELLVCISNITSISDNIAFVTRDEYEMCVLLSGSVESVVIRTKDPMDYIDSATGSFPNMTGIPIQTFVKMAKSLRYNSAKMQLALAIASTVNYTSGKHSLESILQESTKFVTMLYKLAPSKRSPWIKAESVFDYLEDKIGLTLKRTEYRYDEFKDDIQNMLDSLKSPQEILMGETEKMGFDGYTIVKDDVIFFTHELMTLSNLHDKINNVLGDDIEITADMVNKKPAIIAKVPILQRCPSYKSK